MNDNENTGALVGPFSRQLYCHRCNACICERVYIINLALSYTENQLCLKCIAEDKNIKESEVFENLHSYIITRPCFESDWKKVNLNECPKYPSCYCGDINE